MNKYKQDIFKVIIGITKNATDAEDLAQEVFIKIYTNLPNYQNQGFKTWISRIAVNHTIDWVRCQREALQEMDEELENTLSAAVQVEQEVIDRELKELVHQKILDLPANYLDVVKLFYLEGKTYEEIAYIKQVEKKTVETQLYRARAWMRKHWKEEEFI